MPNEFHKQIRKLINKACDANGVPELKYKIDFEFNARFTRRLGDAIYRKSTGRGHLRLSTPLWSRATEEERDETVIHEACHIVVGYKYSYRTSPHGDEWQQAMLNCGVKPERTHQVDRTGIARRNKRWTVSDCPNDKKCSISQKDFTRVLKCGGSFDCRNCGLNVDLHSVEEYEEN